MAKTKTPGKMSSGNKASMNRVKEERRQARFTRRKEDGKVYEYKPNPYKKGTWEYGNEQRDRLHKNVDHKTPVARLTSVMRKLDNQLAKERLERKSRKDLKAYRA